MTDRLAELDDAIDAEASVIGSALHRQSEYLRERQRLIQQVRKTPRLSSSNRRARNLVASARKPMSVPEILAGLRANGRVLSAKVLVAELSREVKRGTLRRVRRGVYEANVSNPAEVRDL